MLLSAGHREGSDGKEPHGGLPHVDRRRGAGGGALPKRTESQVGPSQGGVRFRLLSFLKHDWEAAAEVIAESLAGQGPSRPPPSTLTATCCRSRVASSAC